MAYTNAVTAPKRFQWESNSAPSQSVNCGPTCVTQIAQFYRDRWYGIQSTRRLVVTDDRRGTSATEQAVMLQKRGVPASVRVLSSLSEMHGLVDSGRRPFVIGILMSRVPAAVRDHSFLGWHALVVLGRAYVNGQRGFWLTDPNFSTYRPDPDKGRKFYSDAVIQSAFLNNYPRFCVVPSALKVVTTTQYVRWNSGVNGVNIRTAPDARVANIYAVAWSDADPKPNGIIRRSDGLYLGSVAARRQLYGEVAGPDGQRYYKLKISGTGIYTYVQSRFMHKV